MSECRSVLYRVALPRGSWAQHMRASERASERASPLACVLSVFFELKDTEPSPLQDYSSVRQQGGLLGPPSVVPHPESIDRRPIDGVQISLGGKKNPLNRKRNVIDS